MSDEALRQEIAALRQRVDEAEAWADGIQQSLVEVLPFLLRGHPEVSKVESLLRSSSQRYEVLRAHPERAESADETAGLYESRKMLYHLLALLGVWPGVDPGKAAEQSLRRFAPAMPGQKLG